MPSNTAKQIKKIISSLMFIKYCDKLFVSLRCGYYFKAVDFRYSVLLLIYFLFLSANMVMGAEEKNSQIKENYQNGNLAIHITLPPPEITTIIQNDQRLSALSINNLKNISVIGHPNIPIYKKLLNYPKEKLNVNLQIISQSQISLENPLAFFQDEAKDDRTKTKLQENSSAFHPTNLELRNVGQIQDIPLTALYFIPITVHSEKILSFISEAIITVEMKNAQENIPDYSRFSKTSEALGLGKQCNTITKPFRKTISNPLNNVPALKIECSQDGIYRVNRNKLTESGLDIKNIDPHTIRILHKNRELPIYVNGENDRKFNKHDYVEFYGERNRNSTNEYDPFTDKNIYWMYWGGEPGTRYADESVRLVLPDDDVIQPLDFENRFHFERNESFEKLGHIYTDRLSSEQDQYFFSDRIMAGASQQYIFDLPSPNLNTGKKFTVTLGLQSITTSYNNSVQFLLNGYVLGQGSWDWAEDAIFQSNPEYDLTNLQLKNEDNVLTIIIDNNPTATYSTVVLNWVDINYYRNYQAQDDYIEFHRPKDHVDGVYQFTVKGFSTDHIIIYKKGFSKLRDFEISHDEENDRYNIKMQDNISTSVKYIALTGEKILSPESVYLDTLTNLIPELDGCEHLIISADQFFNKCNELVAFYQSKGVNCKKVKVSDIYDQFNNGIKSPYAIKEFLSAVYQNHSPAPKYILLVGDANLSQRSKDLLPTVYYQTYKYGAAATDHWYTLVTGDDQLPDYCIGRFPCANIDELDRMIRKRISYEQSSAVDSWKNRLLFIAGYEDAFKDQTDYLIKKCLRPPCEIDRLLINPSSVATEYYGGTDSLINKINRGLSVINFMGHGGGAVWGDRSIFSHDDICLLNNDGKLPFISSLTCFTSDFAAYYSLGEALVEEENNGSIGLWGASGLGWIINDFLIGKCLFEFIQEPGLSVGEAILCAKTQYITDNPFFSYLKPSMAFQYNLLGDPAVELSHPQDTVSISVNPSPILPGENFTVSANLPFEDGKAEIRVFDTNKYPICPKIHVDITDNNFSYQSTLPTSADIDYAYVNFYGVNESHTQDCIGSKYFAVAGKGLEKGYSIPDKPEVDQEIYIYAEIIDTVPSLFCEIDTGSVYVILLNNGIEEIRAFQNDQHILNVPMINQSAQIYKTTQPFQIGSPGKQIAYRFSWMQEEEEIKSRMFLLKMKSLPDIYPNSLIQEGENSPAFKINIGLSGDDTVNAKIKVYRMEEGENRLVDSTFTTVMPGEVNSVSSTCIQGQGIISGYIELVPAENIRESNSGNNILHFSERIQSFAITPQLGTTLYGITHDTIQYDSSFAFAVPPGTLTDSCVMFCNKIDNVISNQPGFRMISNSCYELKPSKSQPLNKKYTVIYNGEVLPEYHMVSYDPRLSLWKKENSVIENTKLTAELGRFSRMAISELTDTKKPEVEVSFDGKYYIDGGYVSRNPNISLVFEDENGIDMSEEGCKLYLDTELIEFDALIIPDTLNDGKIVGCNFRPNMSDAFHTLTVSVNDAAGNQFESDYNFQVSSKLELKDYGNYPNPFRTRTWFVYELTQPVESFKIMLYTASGRKIKTLDDMNVFSDLNMGEAGYHEVYWDGCDGFGDRVANGIYFYRMSGRCDDKKVESRGVIAKEK